jgi:hypothetical protein
MENSLHNVADLSDAARTTVESIIGHPLRNDEVLCITTLGAAQSPTDAQRNTGWNELESIIAETQQHAAQSGLTGDQIDALIDAECEQVRYGRDR